MRGPLFDFYSIFENDLEPLLTHVQLGCRVVFDNLEHEFVTVVEDGFGDLAFLLVVFEELILDLLAHVV